MRNVFKYSLLSGSLILAATTQAEESFRQHDAHVHGHVEFNIAQDANELLVEITAPGADVVGFEHAPENAQQRQILANAVKTLKHAEHILLLSAAAGCKVEHESVMHTLGEDDSHEHEGHEHHEDHKHHEHEKHADNKSHDHHEHDKHEHHDHAGQHGEFTVEYHYECQNISKLKSIDTQWFKHFPATEEISVNLLTDSAQLATELSATQHEIKL